MELKALGQCIIAPQVLAGTQLSSAGWGLGTDLASLVPVSVTHLAWLGIKKSIPLFLIFFPKSFSPIVSFVFIVDARNDQSSVDFLVSGVCRQRVEQMLMAFDEPAEEKKMMPFFMAAVKMRRDDFIS